MPNITTYKKPELAIISEVKKMREYSEVERNTNQTIQARNKN